MTSGIKNLPHSAIGLGREGEAADRGSRHSLSLGWESDPKRWINQHEDSESNVNHCIKYTQCVSVGHVACNRVLMILSAWGLLKGRLS